MNHVLLDPKINFMLQWEVSESKEYVSFILQAEVKAYLGIGWGGGSSMDGADYVTVTFDDDKVNTTLTNGTNFNPLIYDMYMEMGKRPPPLPDSMISGCKNDLFGQEGYQTPSFTFIKFKRLLRTGDTKCDHDLSLDGVTYFIWARGESNSFDEHTKSNSGVVAVKLGKKTQPNYIQYHASFLFLGFAILMPIGILIARYFKQYQYWWPLHYIIQGCSFIFILIGIIIGFVMNDGFHTTLHSVLGLITFIFTIFTVVVGYLSHYFYNPMRTQIPVWPDKLHWFTGRFVFIFSWIAIITGLVQYGLPGIAVVFSLFIIFLIGLLIFLEIYKKKYQTSIENINLIKLNDQNNNDNNDNNNNNNNNYNNNNKQYIDHLEDDNDKNNLINSSNNSNFLNSSNNNNNYITSSGSSSTSTNTNSIMVSLDKNQYTQNIDYEYNDEEDDD